MGMRLWMCVSTGNVGMRNAMASTTDAVLWPTPGRLSSSAKLWGTSPPCRSASIWQGRQALEILPNRLTRSAILLLETAAERCAPRSTLAN